MVLMHNIKDAGWTFHCSPAICHLSIKRLLGLGRGYFFLVLIPFLCVGCGNGSKSNSTTTVNNPSDIQSSASVSITAPRMASSPPLMGWTSWNTVRPSYDNLVAAGNAMVSLNKYIKNGNTYGYINMDNYWWGGGRDANGNMVVDNKKWPGGMKAYTDKMHSLGLKVGIYSDVGPFGCARKSQIGSGMLGHYDQDALTFAQWGFDFLKMDFCGGQGYFGPNEPSGMNDLPLDPQAAYTAIHNSLIRAAIRTNQSPIHLNMCDWGIYPHTPDSNTPWYEILPANNYADNGKAPWVWAAGVANSWRTGGDLTGSFWAWMIKGILSVNYHPEGQHTGYINDPDSMQFSKSQNLNITEVNSIFNLWAIEAAPLIFSADMYSDTSLPTTTVSTLTNTDVIAVNQDGLTLQGLIISPASSSEIVITKPLMERGNRAVLLFNNGKNSSTFSINANDLGLKSEANFTVADLNHHESLGSFIGSYTSPSISPEDSLMLLISGQDNDPSDTQTASKVVAGNIIRPANLAFCAVCEDGHMITSMANGAAVTFGGLKSRQNAGYIEISYVNNTGSPVLSRLTVDTNDTTTVSFPPTDGKLGSIVIYAHLNPDATNSVTLSNPVSYGSTGIEGVAIGQGPDISSVSIIDQPL